MDAVVILYAHLGQAASWIVKMMHVRTRQELGLRVTSKKDWGLGDIKRLNVRRCSNVDMGHDAAATVICHLVPQRCGNYIIGLVTVSLTPTR